MFERRCTSIVNFIQVHVQQVSSCETRAGPNRQPEFEVQNEYLLLSLQILATSG